MRLMDDTERVQEGRERWEANAAARFREEVKPLREALVTRAVALLGQARALAWYEAEKRLTQDPNTALSEQELALIEQMELDSTARDLRAQVKQLTARIVEEELERETIALASERIARMMGKADEP